MAEFNAEQIAYAQSAIRSHNFRLRMADTLAEKARIITVRATSAQLKRNRELCGTGLSDILLAHGASGLLNDPSFKSELLKISAVLNEVRGK